MKVTAALLKELGACNTSSFDRVFPASEYPLGVEVSRELCEEHTRDFDWSWVIEMLLNADGRTRHYELTQYDGPVYQAIKRERQALFDEQTQAARAWQEKHGESYTYPTRRTPDEARTEYNNGKAAFEKQFAELDEREAKITSGTFGELFAEHPEFRRNDLDRLQKRIIGRIERDAKQRVDAIDADIKMHNDRIESSHRSLERLEAERIAANEQLEAVSAMLLDEKLVAARSEIETLESKLEQLHSDAADLKAAIAKRDGANDEQTAAATGPAATVTEESAS